MSVDWFTVAAQIVNFFILVWLLKKFLYRPILTAMDNRQQKVRAELAQAQSLSESAAKEKERYVALQEEARELSEEQMRKTRQEADRLRETLFDKARKEAEAAQVRWQNELEREKDLFVQLASTQAAVQFHHLAQSAFRDLADENLEESVVSRFCRLLSNPETEAEFFQRLKSDDKLHVYTAFNLSGSSKEKITQALRLRFMLQPKLHFEHDPALIAGILLESNDHRLAWNVHQFLDDFQTELTRVISLDRDTVPMGAMAD